MNIGNNLKKLRELRNYSQEYVADKLGISQVSYSRVECGTAKISVQRLMVIAQVLDIDIALILNFDENFIFNQCNHCIKKTSNHNFIAEYERKIYLDRIFQLETENERLKTNLYTNKSTVDNSEKHSHPADDPGLN